MRSRVVRQVACVVTIASCLPYLVLKVLWPAGSGVGAADAAAARELTDVRHVVGNAVSVGMQLVAIALVIALTFPWGRRLPTALVLAPVWVATGLLAPLALGLLPGVVAHAAAGGAELGRGTGLGSWVYAVVYGGFILEVVGILAAFVGYVLDRWPGVLRVRMPQLRHVPVRQRTLGTVAAAVSTGYAAVLVAWSMTGERWGGPAGFETVAQRTFLVAQGLTVLAGASAVLVLGRRWGTGRLVVPLGVAWIGTGVTVTSGPLHVLLSNHGDVSPVLLAIALAATGAGLLLTRAAVAGWHPR